MGGGDHAWIATWCSVVDELCGVWRRVLRIASDQLFIRIVLFNRSMIKAYFKVRRWVQGVFAAIFGIAGLKLIIQG